MYRTSEAFEEVIGRETRTFFARMTFDDKSIIDEGIRQASIVSGSCGAEMFTAGAAFSGFASLLIMDPGEDLTNREFLLEIGLLLDDGTIEYVPKGIFSASQADISKTKHTVTLTAWDRLARAGSQIYTPRVLYPCTVGEILDDIEQQTGLIIDISAYPDIINEGDLSFPEEYMVSTVLGFVAGIRGGFAYTDHRGVVVLAPYASTAARQIGADQCIDEILLSDNLVSMDAGGSVTQYTYYPGIVKFMGDPRLEPVDMVEVVDTMHHTRRIPCMSLTLAFDGGAVTTIEAPAKEQADVQWGPIQRRIAAALLAAESAITESSREYTVTDSIDPPDVSAVWSTATPSRSAGQYIWERTVNTYGSGRRETSEPVLLTGNAGEDGEDAVLLRVDSSHGLVFKNNTVSTVLSVTIYKGGEIITDADTMHRVFGAGAYIQWSWMRLGEERYGVISADDSRIFDEGFKFRLSPDDVDVKVTFQCSLIV